jgi:hypothetical protein
MTAAPRSWVIGLGKLRLSEDCAEIQLLQKLLAADAVKRGDRGEKQKNPIEMLLRNILKTVRRGLRGIPRSPRGAS